MLSVFDFVFFDWFQRIKITLSEKICYHTVMRYIPEKDINYKKHSPVRVFTVTNYVSADYVEGRYSYNDIHSHPDAWELAYCAEKSLRVHKNGEEIKLQSGEFTLIRPGASHDYMAESNTSRFFVLSFTCSGDENLYPVDNTVFPTDSFQAGLFSRMIHEISNTYRHDYGLEERIKILDFAPMEDDPFGGEQIVVSCLEMIIIYALRGLTMQGNRVPNTGEFRNAVRDYFISSVSSYIESNANALMSVNSLAAHFSYSRSYFTKLYKDSTGRNLKDEIDSAVLKKACDKLKEEGITVTACSGFLCFNSPQYFSHWFREQTGISPTDFIRHCSE